MSSDFYTQQNNINSPKDSKQLLSAIWRNPNSVHQLGIMDRASGRFQNKHVNSIDNAISMAADLLGKNQEVYFACAEYTSPLSRIAQNTKGAWAFWLDVDCSEEKNVSGKGYASEEFAEQAIHEFCEMTGIPHPTIIVSSGGGIHAYWILDEFLDRETWQQLARKLKAITNVQGFRADDTRTADIASVLRLPETLNLKYQPPRPVMIRSLSEQYVNTTVMKTAIESSHEKYCAAVASEESSVSGNQNHHEPSNDLDRLRTLVLRLDADMEYGDWTKVIMAIHHETTGSEEGFSLANVWSSSGNKYCGMAAMRTKWNSLDVNRSTSYNLGTIINMLKGLGIDYHYQHPSHGFEIGEDTIVLGEVSSPSSVNLQTNRAAENSANSLVISPNPFDKYSLKGQSEEMARDIVAAVPFLDEIALHGQVTVFFAKGNAGKTLITFHLLTDAIQRLRVDPSKVYYLNMDDTGTGLLEKNRIAEEYGFHMLAEGHRNFTANLFRKHLREIIDSGTATGVVLILDTLKKFVGLMDKNETSAFTNLIRPFVARGGTVIALAHTNKNPDKNGNPVYGGVSDILNDIDCAYTIAEISSKDGEKIVEFSNIKRRGDVMNNVAYSYSIESKISYHSLLASVQKVDGTKIEVIKKAESIRTDAQIIEIAEACIRDRINTKMKLSDAVSERACISKRKAIDILEKYTGSDPSFHRWQFVVGNRGAKVYLLFTPN